MDGSGGEKSGAGRRQGQRGPGRSGERGDDIAEGAEVEGDEAADGMVVVGDVVLRGERPEAGGAVEVVGGRMQLPAARLVAADGRPLRAEPAVADERARDRGRGLRV